jgi:hypothetical protein
LLSETTRRHLSVSVLQTPSGSDFTQIEIA